MIEGRVSTKTIVAAWKNRYEIDMSAEFPGIMEVCLCRCAGSGLRFFWPMVAGSPRLYSMLQGFPWYYRSEKWEHERALQNLSCGETLLDVGCGRGEFVGAAARAGLVATGLDSNPRAVAVARAGGHDVSEESLEGHDRQHRGQYDAITAFQILEHVSTPIPFLRGCLSLLKPGGQLIIGVPDGGGWLPRSSSLLDLPPHHVTRWSKEVFRFLPQLLPVDVICLEVEPLDRIHVTDFVNAWIRPVSISTMFEYRRPLWVRVFSRIISTTIVFTGTYRRFSGVSLFAVLRKKL